MDLKPQSQQSISDDQELAKVLAGISQESDAPEASEPIVTTPAPTINDSILAAAIPDPIAPEPEIIMPAAVGPIVAPIISGDLDAIKTEALGELRPLVDKLNVSPEEKFDTYLLLLRSTDDRDLIAPAHTAAKAIADEARRAQALLDIIKEIDYLSQPKI